MTQADLAAGLRSLRESLRQMKALLAWEQLKKEEARPGQVPAFQFQDSIESDLRREYSFFLATSVEMHSILNDPTALNIPADERQYFKAQLLKLEAQVRNLDMPARFYPTNYGKPA